MSRRAAAGSLALAAAATFALVAALALWALGARTAVTQAQGPTPAASTPTAPSKPPAPAAHPTAPGRAPVRGGAPRVRYRIAGCRSHGEGAYLHGPRRRQVAIGFDDGPAPDTRQFVAMLERNRVRATFFLIGEQVSGAYRALLLRELHDGDVLGDHSFTHPDLVRSGGVRGQLQSTLAAIRSTTGYTPCLFRPPYGSYDQSIVSAAHSLRLATILWNVDPTDWALPGTEAIVQRVLAQVQPGSIILSHDGGGPRGETLAAYPTIFARLRARGYRIVTISQLLGFRPVYVPCIRLCEGIGQPRRALPPGAIIERAP